MTTDSDSGEAINGAFGARNRGRLLDKYFTAAGFPTQHNAWEHVYRLLLWTDLTTGLAHCYESDKCQPGKPWYERSLAFHDWLSKTLDTHPAQLATSIDWLFRHATQDLATEVLTKQHRLRAKAEKQRLPFLDRNLPEPGDDPELIAIVRKNLEHHLKADPDHEVWQTLVSQVRQYLGTENKRKNLVGEGFEDVLAKVLFLVCSDLEIRPRALLHDIPGFIRNRDKEKINKVDLAILRPNRRVLVTAKWSIRADREKQFTADFADYVQAESSRKPFSYVLITNEFDPARLMRACEHMVGNSYMFAHVVHISTDAVKATYGTPKSDTQLQVLEHIDSGRLMDFSSFIKEIAE